MKEKIRQLFCRHKEFEYCTKIQPFHHLQGERVYKRCVKCGKIIGSEFLSNEEFMYRFK